MRYVILLLLCSCVHACKEPKAQDELNYDADKIMTVMGDMYVASEALKKMSPERQDSMKVIFMKQIEEIHAVDMALIESDMYTLTQFPEFYTESHKMVRDSLIALEKRISALKYD